MSHKIDIKSASNQWKCDEKRTKITRRNPIEKNKWLWVAAGARGLGSRRRAPPTARCSASTHALHHQTRRGRPHIITQALFPFVYFCIGCCLRVRGRPPPPHNSRTSIIVSPERVMRWENRPRVLFAFVYFCAHTRIGSIEKGKASWQPNFIFAYQSRGCWRRRFLVTI